MPEIETKNFGRIPYEEEAALVFRRGLPGFESQSRFLPLTFPGRSRWCSCKAWKTRAMLHHPADLGRVPFVPAGYDA